jgi:hypothetical protein
MRTLPFKQVAVAAAVIVLSTLSGIAPARAGAADPTRGQAVGAALPSATTSVNPFGGAGAPVASSTASPGSIATAPSSPTPFDAPTKNLTFGIGPASPVPSSQVVDGRPYLNFLASPGGIIQDKVAVYNVGTKPVRLKVYASDAVDSTDGSFTLLPQGAKQTDAGSWIKLATPRHGMVTVPPARETKHGKKYGRVIVPFTVTIPADATPGDHAAGILASLQTISTTKQGARVKFDQRIGIRAYFQLAGTVVPKVAIEGFHASYHRDKNLKGHGTVTMSYVVHNTGNLRVSVSPLATITRYFAKALHEYPAVIPDILPGAKVDVTETVPAVGDFGRMKATVTLFPTPVDTNVSQKGAPVLSSATFWAWPWLVIGIAAVAVLALLAAGGWWWRHRREDAESTPPGPRQGSDRKKPVLVPPNSPAA